MQEIGSQSFRLREEKSRLTYQIKTEKYISKCVCIFINHNLVWKLVMKANWEQNVFVENPSVLAGEVNYSRRLYRL